MDAQKLFNERVRQVLLLSLIILLAYLMILQLYVFLPGLLGGITLYILSRNLYFRLIFKKKWKKGWTAFLFILAYLIIIALPIYFSIQMISPKINALINNQEKIIETLKIFSDKITAKTGFKILTEDSARSLSQKITSFVPKILNSSANVLTNLIMLFFLLYYLLVNGKAIERYLVGFIPFKPGNVDKLSKETKVMIRANAIGIPIISIVQGIFAALGYWIFGVDDWALWGFVTGVFAFFPIVGTMIIWIPLVIYMYTSGHHLLATGLAIYSVVVTGNVDYITRLGLMKRLGNVHPMVTVLGVIIGLGLFGFMGLIFGPLLVSYFLIMVKIYMNEFTDSLYQDHDNVNSSN